VGHFSPKAITEKPNFGKFRISEKLWAGDQDGYAGRSKKQSKKRWKKVATRSVDIGAGSARWSIIKHRLRERLRGLEKKGICEPRKIAAIWNSSNFTTHNGSLWNSSLVICAKRLLGSPVNRGNVSQSGALLPDATKAKLAKRRAMRRAKRSTTK